MRRLLIISDTAVYQQGSEMFAYEPVMREVRALSPMFDELIWLGSRVNKCTGILTGDKPHNVKIVSMPSVRHGSFNSARILLAYPVFLVTILKYFFSATHIHTRGPSHPAFIGLLLSLFDNRRKYWHKYAGNRMSQSTPRMYRLQLGLLRRLKKNNIRITVNGKLPGDYDNVLSFENPCLSEREREEAQIVARGKDFSGTLNLLFVGELNRHKGIANLIDAIRDNPISSRIGNLYIAGDGPLYEELKERVLNITNPRVHLLGSLSRAELNKYYAVSHALVLPSSSEGFPKVVAEAAAFGCIPVATNISVLSNYVDHGRSGILMPDNAPTTISEAINELAGKLDLKQMSSEAAKDTGRFTYEYFRDRIKNEIFHL